MCPCMPIEQMWELCPTWFEWDAIVAGPLQAFSFTTVAMMEDRSGLYIFIPAEELRGCVEIESKPSISFGVYVEKFSSVHLKKSPFGFVNK